MENKYYLRLKNNKISFVLDGIHEIIETDIYIENEDYNKFFELQSLGKQFRLVEKPTGVGLFDYIEEYEEIIDTTSQEPTQEERIKVLENLMLEVL